MNRLVPRRATRPAGGSVFVKGFVVGGCLSAFQGRTAPASAPELKRVLRRALQGGAALAAGERAAAAFARRNYGSALIATAAGATGVLLIEKLLRDVAQPAPESNDGQEA